MLLLTSAILIGVALGRRYTVYILIPVSLVSAGVFLSLSFAGHGSFWSNALIAASIIVTLQISYFAAMIVFPFSDECQEKTGVPDGLIDNIYGHTDVVYLHKYQLTKTR